jgi:hypothetical protein
LDLESGIIREPEFLGGLKGEGIQQRLIEMRELSHGTAPQFLYPYFRQTLLVFECKGETGAVS